MNLNLNKYFKKWKISNIFILLAFIIDIVFIFLFVFLDSYVYSEKFYIEILIANLIISIMILITISILTIDILLKTSKLRKKYNIYINSIKQNKFEPYFLNIDNINLKDEKFQIVKKYVETKKIKIIYMQEDRKVLPVIFPNFKKLKAILEKKTSFNEKVEFIDLFLCSEPLKLKLKKEYLDKEQISYLRYLIIENFREEQ
ncbi:hypothetical protein [Metamycoplasma buccale]|uniref:hypothetical protein n=1 Tax=Metamycoplasma buccale TaxID=55602 RepID=UPI00398F4726